MPDTSLLPLKSLVYKLFKQSRADMEKRFAQARVGITPLQYAVLCIVNTASITINELARKLMLQPPSLVPVIDSLEESKFLERKNDPNDRRKIQLVMTKKGQKLIKNIPFDDKDDTLNRAFSMMPVEKQTQLLTLLQELANNIPHHG